MINIERLTNQLIIDEGLELKMYHCSMGHPTIGVGRNLSVGITEGEAKYLLKNDIARVAGECINEFSWFNDLSEKRKEAVINLVFNMGMATFKKFKKTIAFIEAGEYEKAGVELLDSNYARQVGQRSQRVADMLTSG